MEGSAPLICAAIAEPKLLKVSDGAWYYFVGIVMSCWNKRITVIF